MRVVAYKGQYRITLPKDLVDEMGWHAGTKLRFVELSDGTIILKEIKDEKVHKRK